MKKILLYALLALGSFVAPVHAQQAASALILSSCGTLPAGVTYAAGQYGIQTMDTTGKSCSGATFSGSVSATTAATSASTLPTLSPSASSPIYESLGAGLYVQPVFSSASGGGTQVDATHGLPVNVIAGGAGGGAVFGPTAVGSAAANPPVLAGGTIDGTATGNVSVNKVVAGIAYLNTAQVNGVTTLAGAGAVGTGSQRVAVGQDTTTIAGSAPGTAGTASANVLTAQGIASMTPFLVNPGTIGNWGLAASTQNGTTPTNGGLVMGQFNTSPTTITAGNISPLQMDASGNLLVNIKAGAGSGGTSSNFSATFPTAGTAAGAEYLTSAPTLTTGQMVALQTDVNGNLKVNIIAGAGSGGTALADGATFTIGTTSETPSACTFVTGGITITSGKSSVLTCTAAGSLHTTVDNTNANGQAAMANSSPVVIASNQSSVPTNTAQVNGVTVLTGTGATGTGAQRVTVSTDQTTNAGAALVKGGVGVVNGASGYQAVAASATATVLQSSTGAAGDYLSHCDIYPATTSPGVVTVFDSTNTAANSVILFPGGASSVSNLAPIPVPVGAISVNGAWKVTTGANVSVACFGKFS